MKVIHQLYIANIHILYQTRTHNGNNFILQSLNWSVIKPLLACQEALIGRSLSLCWNVITAPYKCFIFSTRHSITFHGLKSS